jgi:glyoxylase-like metal-dependent hydrolase (beta-lactamase superfamily II)
VKGLKSEKVGTRGFLFGFEKPYRTNVFVINGSSHVFVCDTCLGSEPMNLVKRYLAENGLDSKPVVVFNSHGDYDHFWGNGCFRSSLIIGHELCRKRIENEAQKDLEEFKGHKLGEVEIVAPNVVFDKRLFFADEGVEFYHTPGHTDDSSSCFDHVDGTLFVGDNVESPIPYVSELDLAVYSATLEEYTQRNAKAIVAGHAEAVLDAGALVSCLNYLKDLETSDIDIVKLGRRGRIIHHFNLASIGEKLREKGMMKEALERYRESKLVLDQMEDDVIGKQEQMKKIQEIIAALSKERSTTGSDQP